MCATGSDRPQAFFSAGDTSLSQEVADGKISVKTACALNTVHTGVCWLQSGSYLMIPSISAQLSPNRINTGQQ
jgi:hypothetical protein